MKIKFTAKIEGNIFLNKPCSFNKDNYLIEFNTNNEKKITEITIIVKVEDKEIEKYESKIFKKDNIVHISIGGDPSVLNKIRNVLQLLESNLSFVSTAALYKINWENIRVEYIPESEDEREKVKLLSISMKEEYPQPRTCISNDVLAHYALSGERYNELAIPKAFYREGLNYFRNFQYVQAFYNYYFIIEGFYANGKTSEKEILKEFSRSAEFSKILGKSLNQIKDDKRHGNKLLELLKNENCSIDITGLQELIFKMRGKLHHYSQGSHRVGGTPFNQKEFETIALVCGHIACLSIGYREEKINTTFNSKPI